MSTLLHFEQMNREETIYPEDNLAHWFWALKNSYLGFQDVSGEKFSFFEQTEK